MPFEARCQLNYDHPDAFDTERLVADLQALRRGETVYSPTYDYTVHNRSAETSEVRPAKVLLVEGILIFQNPELRDMLDIKIFVDGGIRSGVDILKALALGADAVLIGRPFVTAVYGGAAEGVSALTEKLSGELADAMAMCGVHSLSEITREVVR